MFRVRNRVRVTIRQNGAEPIGHSHRLANKTSVREYVFFVFFRFQKKRDFLRFFETTLKKT